MMLRDWFDFQSVQKEIQDHFGRKIKDRTDQIRKTLTDLEHRFQPQQHDSYFEHKEEDTSYAKYINGIFTRHWKNMKMSEFSQPTPCSVKCWAERARDEDKIKLTIASDPTSKEASQGAGP
eukprot:UN04600